MDDLKSLVEELETKRNEKEIEAHLQMIGKTLITDYAIKVDDIIIEPLWVEAYYNDGNYFTDPFVHKNEKQMEPYYGELYFHHKTDDKRNGVDICLSLGHYYLSFLLKYTLVDNIVRSQSELSPLIRNKYERRSNEEKTPILIPKPNPTSVISYTERIGLTFDKESDESTKKLKEKYKDLKLSIVRDFDKAFKTNFKFPKRESLVKDYLNHSESLNQMAKEELCNKALGYCLKEFKSQ